jgi:hypothetical protein
MPILSFIEKAVSKRKLFKYLHSDQFYEVINEFKSEIKEVLIMKSEDWTQHMENSIEKLYITHLLNI